MKLDGLVWARCAECWRETYIPEANRAIHIERGEVRLCNRCILDVMVPDTEYEP
ncbi:uncharacterized protein Nmag_0257 [Natrialba magadii ATCC 43099]|uniref:Uncharacterized protein n=1 Tax=Natrialba magadii (strain ATCC 43099 / DSM 3394 / CCM 3739 / CIP 104546 / IAM 13178 / JCM 8861 / NBRC 102185 / NCIMB 2190 / MS3) TaxID=547559 RepID=D3SX29_NATMM|nr:uncharacterized protein Nmag_0257 [Natrialba magadii ATCC 43099]ELY33508.1 hypothetical protein C500_01710 [Natrialba magadii ATCC 43099]